MNRPPDWRGPLLRGLYTALLYLALPLALARLYWRGRRDPDHRRRWRERLGFIPPLPEGLSRPCRIPAVCGFTPYRSAKLAPPCR